MLCVICKTLFFSHKCVFLVNNFAMGRYGGGCLGRNVLIYGNSEYITHIVTYVCFCHSKVNVLYGDRI